MRQIQSDLESVSRTALGADRGNCIFITNCRGRSFAGAWGDEPRASLSITVPNFPNVFAVYGPSIHGGLIFTNPQRQVRWVEFATRVCRWGKRIFEVKPTALKRYVRGFERVLQRTSWQDSESYTENERGTINAQRPWNAYAYRITTRLFGHVEQVR